jgi:hypothetical protein
MERAEWSEEELPEEGDAPTSRGRAPPRVRREEPESSRGHFIEALNESLPFILFGVVCIGLSIWLWDVSPAPGSVLPLWILLLGIGMIALLGGILAMVLGENAPEVRSSRTRTSGSRTPSARGPVRPRAVAPASPPEPAAPIPPAYRPPEPSYDDWPVRRPLFDLGALRMETEDLAEIPTDRPASPEESIDPLLRLRRTPSAAPIREPDVREAGDEVLRSIDDLSVYVRGDDRPRRTAAPSSSSPTRDSWRCGNCEKGFPGTELDHPCRTCGASLCRMCFERSTQDGQSSLCSVCTLLEGVPDRQLAAAVEPPVLPRLKVTTGPRAD